MFAEITPFPADDKTTHKSGFLWVRNLTGSENLTEHPRRRVVIAIERSRADRPKERQRAVSRSANLSLVSGPETCGDCSVPGIVPAISSTEEVTQAVWDRSTRGRDEASGSLRTGGVAPVRETSPTGANRGMDSASARPRVCPRGHSHRKQGCVHRPWCPSHQTADR